MCETLVKLLLTLCLCVAVAAAGGDGDDVDHVDGWGELAYKRCLKEMRPTTPLAACTEFREAVEDALTTQVRRARGGGPASRQRGARDRARRWRWPRW